MTLAFWIAVAVMALVSVLTLRGTVAVIAKRADNGWDNAITYVLVTGLVLFFPCRWMVGSGAWIWMVLAPVVCWVVQVIAVRWIYELNPLHSWMVAVTHTVFSTVANVSVAIGAGVVAAYILYGQIISDPVRIIRIILRLIGIEPPF